MALIDRSLRCGDSVCNGRDFGGADGVRGRRAHDPVRTCANAVGKKILGSKV